MENLQRIALLIDADNTQLAKLEDVIQEISTHGRIVVKRAYGNWRKDTLKNWENELKRLAIKAEQQFDYVSGKNTTDMALVIDTMNLLHKGIYDAFVIVASEKKTPEAFRNSCDEFIFLENLGENIKEAKSKTESSEKAIEIEEECLETATVDSTKEDISVIHNLLKIASDKYQDDEGYVNVSSAGQFIKRVKPDFDVRTFGFIKLPKLIEAFPRKYEIKKYPGKGKVTIIAYRCK